MGKVEEKCLHRRWAFQTASSLSTSITQTSDSASTTITTP